MKLATNLKIFISGNPKSGKTTLVERLISEIGINNFLGFYSKEVKDSKGKRIGFDIYYFYNNKLEVLPLARVDAKTKYKIGKYYVFLDNINKISSEIIDILNSIVILKSKILVIDEIGRMELLSDKFRDLVRIILNEDIPLLATVHRHHINIVPYYIWINRYNWWDVYKRVKSSIQKYLKNITIK